MLSSDTRPLARTVTTAVQSSHVLAATTASKVEQTRNDFIFYWESLDDWEILEDFGRLTGRVLTTWSAEDMKIAVIYLDKHWSWWTFCRSEIKTFNASL